MTKRMEQKRECSLTQDVSEVLKEFRLSRGFSQRKLATTIVGSTGSCISSIERGISSPTVHTLNRILGALGYSFFELAQAVEAKQKNRSVA